MSLIPSAKDLAGALAPVLQQSIQQLADVEPGVLQAVVEDALAKVASTDIPALQAAVQGILDGNVVRLQVVAGGVEISFVKKA